MNPPLDWLLAGEPFVAYRTHLDLLGASPDEPDVRSLREAMLADPRVVALLDDLAA